VRRHMLSIPVVGAVAIAAAAGAAWGVTGNKPLGQNLVGRQSDGWVLTAQNQFVRPAGESIEQTGQPMDLEVSPDGRTAVSLTKSGDGLFTVVDLVDHTVLQQYSPPKGTGSGDIGVGGLLYSPDGKVLWATQSKNLLRFTVAAGGTLSTPVVIPIPTDGPGKTPVSSDKTPAAPLPSDLAWNSDHSAILVVLDGYNRLARLDPASDTVTAISATGVGPRDVAVIGDHAFVSNEAGRQPTAEDFTNLSYDSETVAEPRNGRASDGTISEFDLATGDVVHTYQVGLDPSSMVVRGSALLVTNSSDDTVSVVDTAHHQVTQTINVNPLPGQPYGASPNALAFLDKTHLAVSLGRDNAIAVYDWRGRRTAAAFCGLIPTAWYPGKLVWNEPLGKLVVGNLKGVGALGKERIISEGPGTSPAIGHQVFADKGVVQVLDTPSPKQMSRYTSTVFAANQWNGLNRRNQTGARTAPAKALPLKVGDPSKIKHVFMVVRENRTYDQELGDDPRGNGQADLAQFGRRTTPNAHALARQFPLIDNLYSTGTNSATGHTWLDAAFVNDYLERSYANYVRNYGQPDSMVYPKSGFLWDNALAHCKTARVWGEYAPYFTSPSGQDAKGTWSQWYQDSRILEGKAAGDLHAPVGYYQARSDVPSLDRILSRDYPNFQTQITDQYRADIFLRDLEQHEHRNDLPSLNMLWVPQDHTSGIQPGQPTPSAMVADNDLATGRIIEAISKSRFWSSSAVFVVEDDSQNGVDHVDGHRNVTLVASPYARKGAVVHDYYTQLNVTRTIEQILGLPPMNQLDLAAEPMRALFTDTPDLRPYVARPNRIPLDTLNPTAAQVSNPMQKKWIAWSTHQDFGYEDELAFAPFNRLTWYASTGWKRPYPGDAKVLTPAEVEALFPRTPASEHEPQPITKALVPHRAGEPTW
jgi:YVTN family beta-propeller protein